MVFVVLDAAAVDVVVGFPFFFYLFIDLCLFIDLSIYVLFYLLLHLSIYLFHHLFIILSMYKP